MNITENIKQARSAQRLFKLINESFFFSFSGLVTKVIEKTILTKKKGWKLTAYHKGLESSSWLLEDDGEEILCLIETEHIGFYKIQK
tara:strand:- start:1727 stop:1987 length:261 start_codon:yes stop_codon:yes gene_type:complete